LTKARHSMHVGLCAHFKQSFILGLTEQTIETMAGQVP